MFYPVLSSAVDAATQKKKESSPRPITQVFNPGVELTFARLLNPVNVYIVAFSNIVVGVVDKSTASPGRLLLQLPKAGKAPSDVAML